MKICRVSHDTEVTNDVALQKIFIVKNQNANISNNNSKRIKKEGRSTNAIVIYSFNKLWIIEQLDDQIEIPSYSVYFYLGAGVPMPEENASICSIFTAPAKCTSLSFLFCSFPSSTSGKMRHKFRQLCISLSSCLLEHLRNRDYTHTCITYTQTRVSILRSLLIPFICLNILPFETKP